MIRSLTEALEHLNESLEESRKPLPMGTIRRWGKRVWAKGVTGWRPMANALSRAMIGEAAPYVTVPEVSKYPHASNPIRVDVIDDLRKLLTVGAAQKTGVVYVADPKGKLSAKQIEDLLREELAYWLSIEVAEKYDGEPEDPKDPLIVFIHKQFPKLKISVTAIKSTKSGIPGFKIELSTPVAKWPR